MRNIAHITLLALTLSATAFAENTATATAETDHTIDAAHSTETTSHKTQSSHDTHNTGHGKAAALPTAADIPTLGDAKNGETLAATCAACHGQKGQSTIAENPKLAGQSARYLHAQLVAFKSGARENAIMVGQVANLDEQGMKDLATYFAAQTPVFGEPGEGDSELGHTIYNNGIPDRNIPACIACHGIDGSGMAAAGYPALAGQHAGYLSTRLQAMAIETNEDKNAQIMQEIAARLRPAEVEGLASYMQGLQP